MDIIAKAIPLDNYRIDIFTSSGLTGIFDEKTYLNERSLKINILV